MLQMHVWETIHWSRAPDVPNLRSAKNAWKVWRDFLRPQPMWHQCLSHLHMLWSSGRRLQREDHGRKAMVQNLGHHLTRPHPLYRPQLQNLHEFVHKASNQCTSWSRSPQEVRCLGNLQLGRLCMKGRPYCAPAQMFPIYTRIQVSNSISAIVADTGWVGGVCCYDLNCIDCSVIATLWHRRM